MANKKFKYRVFLTLFLPFFFILNSCNQNRSSKEQYLTMDDFKKMNKIDIHCHINAERNAFMEQAVEDNFRILTLNTDAFDDLTIRDQRKIALDQQKSYPGRLAWLTTFSMKGWDDPGLAGKDHRLSGGIIRYGSHRGEGLEEHRHGGKG